MSPNEQKLYSVIYDRFYIWKQKQITLSELADETRINKASVNTHLWRMNNKHFELIRNGRVITICSVNLDYKG